MSKLELIALAQLVESRLNDLPIMHQENKTWEAFDKLKEAIFELEE
jgi:hypothetical protein